MNRSLRSVLVLLAVAAAVVLTAGTVSAHPIDCTAVSYAGAGTQPAPYEVDDPATLQCIDAQDLDGHYRLTTSIDASATADWPSGFVPIGTEHGPFTGTLDGDGHAITGVVVDGDDRSGLVAHVGPSGTIHGLAVEDAHVSGDNATGILAGQLDGTMADVSASGTVRGTSRVGGGVGYQQGRLTRAEFEVAVNGTAFVGGAAGTVAGELSRVTVTGPVDGEQMVGGAGGTLIADGTIRQASAAGPVAGETSVGGLVGSAVGDGRMENVSATAAVRGTGSDVGGLVGYVGPLSGSTTIERGYARGAVTGTTRVGGIVGAAPRGAALTELYAASTVAGQHAVGGVAGTADVAVDRVHYDREVAGVADPAGAVDHGTAALHGETAPDALAGFDFENHWSVRADAYPELAWQRARHASFAVAIEEATVVDDAVAVTATVRNAGGRTGTGGIELVIDGTTVDATDRTLRPGASTTVTLAGVPNASDDRVRVTVRTSDDADTTTIDTGSAGGGGGAAADASAVTVDVSAANDTVAVGSSVTLEVEMTNAGTRAVTRQLSVGTTNGTTIANRTVTLDPGDTTVRSFAWRPTAAAVGHVGIVATTGDEAATTTVVVEPRRTGAVVPTIRNVTDPAVVGEQARVEVTVERQGSVDVDGVVELVGPNGEAVDERPVDLAPNERRTYTMGWTPTAVAEAATLTVRTPTNATTVDVAVVADRMAAAPSDPARVSIAGGDGEPVAVVPGDEWTTARAASATVNVTGRPYAAGTADLAEDVSSFETATGTVAVALVAVDGDGPSTVTARVASDRLDALGAAPSDVTFYASSGDNWTALPTARDGETATVSVNGSRVLAVGTEAPVVAVADATLRTPRVSAGEAGAVEVTLSHRGFFEHTTDLETTANGSAIDVTTVRLGPGEVADRTLTVDPPVGEWELAVEGVPAGTLRVDGTDATGTTRWPLAVLLGAILLVLWYWRRE